MSLWRLAAGKLRRNHADKCYRPRRRTGTLVVLVSGLRELATAASPNSDARCHGTFLVDDRSLAQVRFRAEGDRTADIVHRPARAMKRHSGKFSGSAAAAIKLSEFRSIDKL